MKIIVLNEIQIEIMKRGACGRVIAIDTIQTPEYYQGLIYQ